MTRNKEAGRVLARPTKVAEADQGRGRKLGSLFVGGIPEVVLGNASAWGPFWTCEGASKKRKQVGGSALESGPERLGKVERAFGGKKGNLRRRRRRRSKKNNVRERGCQVASTSNLIRTMGGSLSDLYVIQRVKERRMVRESA